MTLAYAPDFQPTIHDWDEWMNPHVPVVGPPIRWYNIDTAVPHYTADDDLIDGDAGERYSDIPIYLRNIQAAYEGLRGYSIGYNFAVDWLGGIWILRGWNILPAANKFHNEHTITILLLVDGADPTTLAADMSVRWLIDQSEMKVQDYLNIVGHGSLQKPHNPTACPGAGINHKISSGVYSPRWTPTPPPSKDTDMTKLYLITDANQSIDPAQFAITGTYAEWISTEADSSALLLTGIAQHQGVPGVPPAQPFTMDRGFLKQYTLIGMAPMYPNDYMGPRTNPADFRKWVA